MNASTHLIISQNDFCALGILKKQKANPTLRFGLLYDEHTGRNIGFSSL